MAGAESNKSPEIDEIGQVAATDVEAASVRGAEAAAAAKVPAQYDMPVSRFFGEQISHILPKVRPENTPRQPGPNLEAVAAVCDRLKSMDFDSVFVDTNRGKPAQLSRMVDLVLYHCGKFERSVPIGAAKSDLSSAALGIAQAMREKPSTVAQLIEIAEELDRLVKLP